MSYKIDSGTFTPNGGAGTYVSNNDSVTTFGTTNLGGGAGAVR